MKRQSFARTAVVSESRACDREMDGENSVQVLLRDWALHGGTRPLSGCERCKDGHDTVACSISNTHRSNT